MKDTTLSKHRLPLGALVCSLLASNLASAQDADSGESEDKVFELSPFTVNAADDTGWLAQNTLAGSRLNSTLKDTPAVLDVLTSEMLDELGIDDFASALALSANFDENLGDLGDFSGVINSSFPGAAQNLNFQTRGQRGALARNFIPTGFRPEFYTTERIDNSSGPNAILFGIGGAGGVANVTTKRARLKRDTNSVQFRGDDNGSLRVHYDGNRVLIEDKLALRVNAVRERKETYREWSGNDLDGLHVTLKARPFERTEINLELEKDHRDGLVVDRRTIRQRLDRWVDAGSQVLTAADSAAGVGSFASAQRWVWIEDERGSYLANQSRALQTLGSSSGFVTDEVQAPFEVNLSGPGGRREINRELAAISIDQRLAEKVYLNLSLSHEAGDAASHQTFFNGTGTGDTFLSGDPNATIRNGSTIFNPEEIAFETDGANLVNPYAGELFVEGRWLRRAEVNSRDYAQLTLAWTLETERLGRHNFVSNLGYTETKSDTTNSDFVWSGAPFNATVNNASNRIYTRNYVTEGDSSTYHTGDWADLEGVEWQHPTFGILTADWVPTTRRKNDVRAANGLFAVQSFLFNDRLVTTFGLRRDEQTTYTFAPLLAADQDDPIYAGRPNFQQINENSSISVAEDGGNTKSLGAVFHVTQNVSVYYNQSDSFAPGNALLTGSGDPFLNQRSILLPKPQEDGEGMDMGLKFRFGDRKYSLDIGYFDTSTVNTSGTLSINSRAADSVGGHWDSIFATLNNPAVGPQLFDASDEAAITALAERYTNLRPEYVHSRDLLDRASNGYELRFTANPSKNLRLRATYAYTNASKESILQRTVAERAQLGAYLGDLAAANPGVDLASLIRPGAAEDSDILTLGAHLASMDVLIDEIIDLNSSNFGKSRHTFNFNAGYDFKDSLKGLNVSGGVKYRSGYRASEYQIIDPAEPRVILDVVEINAPSVTDFNLSLRYKTKMDILGEGTKVTFQVSADNLFRLNPEPQARRYPIRRVAPGEELPPVGNPSYAFLLDPRTISASVKIDF